MEPCTEANETAVVPRHDSDQPPKDLLAFYHTLNAIKTELVHGPGSDEEENEDEEVPENEQDPSFQAAKAFRHHLQGLFGVLKQLTGSAKLLTSRYQEEIGELASPGVVNGLSTFTL